MEFLEHSKQAEFISMYLLTPELSSRNCHPHHLLSPFPKQILALNVSEKRRDKAPSMFFSVVGNRQDAGGDKLLILLRV